MESYGAIVVQLYADTMRWADTWTALHTRAMTVRHFRPLRSQIPAHVRFQRGRIDGLGGRGSYRAGMFCEYSSATQVSLL